MQYFGVFCESQPLPLVTAQKQPLLLPRRVQLMPFLDIDTWARSRSCSVTNPRTLPFGWSNRTTTCEVDSISRPCNSLMVC